MRALKLAVNTPRKLAIMSKIETESSTTTIPTAIHAKFLWALVIASGLPPAKIYRRPLIIKSMIASTKAKLKSQVIIRKNMQ